MLLGGTDPRPTSFVLKLPGQLYLKGLSISPDLTLISLLDQHPCRMRPSTLEIRVDSREARSCLGPRPNSDRKESMLRASTLDLLFLRLRVALGQSKPPTACAYAASLVCEAARNLVHLQSSVGLIEHRMLAAENNALGSGTKLQKPGRSFLGSRFIGMTLDTLKLVCRRASLASGEHGLDKILFVGSWTSRVLLAGFQYRCFFLTFRSVFDLAMAALPRSDECVLRTTILNPDCAADHF